MEEHPMPYRRYGGRLHYAPSLNLGSSGPMRVVTNEDDPDFKPPRLLGFTARTVEREPLTWEGDDA